MRMPDSPSIEQLGLVPPAVTFGRPYFSELPPRETVLHDGPDWIEELRATEVGGYSYRGFDVKARTLIKLANGEQYIIDTQNVKLGPGIPKHCSEPFGLDEAIMADPVEVGGMVVVAPSDTRLIEAVTGAPTSTLHTCTPCRGKFEVCIDRHRERVDPDMPILTAGSETDGSGDKVEYHTPKGFINRYRHPASAHPTFWQRIGPDLGFRGWRHRRKLLHAVTGVEPTASTAIGLSPDTLGRFVVMGSQPEIDTVRLQR